MRTYLLYQAGDDFVRWSAEKRGRNDGFAVGRGKRGNGREKATGKENGRRGGNQAVIPYDPDAVSGTCDSDRAGDDVILKMPGKGGDAYEELFKAAL